MAKLVSGGIINGKYWNWRIEDLQDPFMYPYYDEVGLCTKEVAYGSASLAEEYIAMKCEAPLRESSLHYVTDIFVLEEGITYKFWAYAKSEGLYYPVTEGVPLIIEIPTELSPPKEPEISNIINKEEFPEFTISVMSTDDSSVIIEISESMYDWDKAYRYGPFNIGSGEEATVSLRTFLWTTYGVSPKWATNYYIRSGLDGTTDFYSGIVQVTTPPDSTILSFIALGMPDGKLNPYRALTIYEEREGYGSLDDFIFDYYKVSVYCNDVLMESRYIYKNEIDYSEGAYKLHFLNGTEAKDSVVDVRVEVRVYWKGLQPVDSEGETHVWIASRSYTVEINQWRPEFFSWVTYPVAELAIHEMSYENDWNALMDNISAVVKYKLLQGDTLPDNSDIYGVIAGYDFVSGLESAKMTLSDRELLAVRYNIAAYIIGQMTGVEIDKHRPKEKVLASYLTALSSNRKGINSVE